MDLYLRKIRHEQARDNYRVVLKSDGDEVEIGSIGLQTFTGSDAAWVWAIDTVIPMRSFETEGRGADRRDCMAKFKKAWERFVSDEATLVDFMAAKRRRC